jgi:cell division protein ZapA
MAMTEKIKTNVTIDGRNFTVVGEGSEEYIKELAAFVDEKIKEMTSKNDKLSSSMAATLAALNIAHDLYKSNEELTKLKAEAKAPLENYNRILEQLEKEQNKNKELIVKCNTLKDEVIETKKQNELLSREIENLKRAMEIKERELKENQTLIKKLQDKIYENQVELIEVKKELEEVLKTVDEEKNLFSKEEV